MRCRTNDRRIFQVPDVLDEYSVERLVIRERRNLHSGDSVNVTSDLSSQRLVPSYFDSDSGQEFVAQAN